MKRLLAVLFVLAGCSAPERAQPSLQTETFVVASTTSTQDSGLLDVLTPAFETAFPRYRAKVVAVGSGEAMELGRRGDADVLLVHSPDDEERFMGEGRGIFRKPVMRNDFVIAGPSSDPARVRQSTDATGAFRRIAQSRAPFVSRGDDSGTHKRELKTWKAAGITPEGKWYLESGQGMAESLILASEQKAYVLTDTATFTVVRSKAGLEILLSGDPLLVNPYSVIPVKGARHPQAALAFAEWVSGPPGQLFIADFGQREYGKALFEPTGGK